MGRIVRGKYDVSEAKFTFEAKLLAVSDVLRNNNANGTDCQHVIMGSIHVLANPPFSDSDWRDALQNDDTRWAHGGASAGRAGSTSHLEARA